MANFKYTTPWCILTPYGEWFLRIPHEYLSLFHFLTLFVNVSKGEVIFVVSGTKRFR